MARMPESYQQYEKHFVELSDSQNQEERTKLWVAQHSVVCTEDRGIKGIRFASQTPGGAHGMEMDADMANAFSAEGKLAVVRGDLVENARWIAEMTGATNHLSCAAIAKYVAIAEYQADPKNADKLLHDSNELAPGVVSERHIEIAQAHLKLRLAEAANASIGIEEILEAMGTEGEDGMGVPMLPLHHAGSDHAGRVMIGNDVPGTYYDTARAFKAGPDDAAYGITLHALPNLGRMINVNPDNFMAATTLRSVAVAANLPNSDSPTGLGVTPVYRGRSVHEVA